MPEPGPWGELRLDVDERRTFALGTLRLVVERTAAEVRLQTLRGPDFPHVDEPEWQRWAVPLGSRLELRPAVPDRLVVVSHEQPFHLPPRGEARVFVRVPLFVQLVVEGDRTSEVVVTDEPSVVLSDTWWGTYAEGELGYWLTTSARPEITEDLFLPHVAMCPFQLANRGAGALPVERFAVQVPHLTVFSDRGRNWTDEVRVRYDDAGEGSEIKFGRHAPREATDAAQIAGPRVATPKSLHARTFSRLKSLSGLGAEP